MSKVKLTEDEKLAARLQNFYRNGIFTDREKEIAKSLQSYFLSRHEFTYKQRELIKSLLKNKKVVKRKIGYYLYAIATDRDVKLGFSSSPSKRLLDLQTSNSCTLKILWKCYTGDVRSAALKNERKLHKVCKKYKINREWFELDCMSLVVNFKPKFN